MTNLPQDGEELPDKEIVSLGTNENKTPATSSEGEYSEEKKQVLSAMKAHYGEDLSPDSEDYTSKLEGMVATDLLPKVGKLKSYDEANTKIIAMMEAEPVLSSIMTEVGQGRKFMNSVKSHMSELDADIPEDDSDMAAWENNAKMRESKYNEKLARQAEIASNEEKSMATLEAFISEKGLDDANKIKFGQLIADFLDRAYSGDITKQFLEIMYYYMNRDTELAKASEMGEIRGKNAKIEKTKFAEEDYTGDGLPDINSGGGISGNEEDKTVSDPVLASLNRHLDQKPILGNR